MLSVNDPDDAGTSPGIEGTMNQECVSPARNGWAHCVLLSRRPAGLAVDLAALLPMPPTGHASQWPVDDQLAHTAQSVARERCIVTCGGHLSGG